MVLESLKYFTSKQSRSKDKTRHRIILTNVFNTDKMVGLMTLLFGNNVTQRRAIPNAIYVYNEIFD